MVTKNQNRESVSLYFHIPFCRKKCPYCHFYVIPDKQSFKDLLADAIALEWNRQAPLLSDKQIVSIYFGGGTPTLFAPEGIDQILSQIRQSNIAFAKDIEITIEANPEDASLPLFSALLSFGINRLSLGVQSLDDRSLTILERGHAAKKAKDALFLANQAGFKNISIDLMYDLPDQTESSWSYTLQQLSDLPIQHVSLYNLTIEPHTSFYKRKSSLQFPDAITSLNLLHMAIKTLKEQQFARYEISAFAKTGYQSRHNKGYWTGRPFLGFGPSAFSYWEGARFRNVANLQRYAKQIRAGISPIDFSEILPSPKNFQELLAVRLRLLEGADMEQYPKLPSEVHTALEKWTREGCLDKEGSIFRLTERGTLFYDAIASDLV